MENINKNNSFKTPEGYFEKVTEKLMDRIAHKDSRMPKEDGFTVPSGYFEHLDKKLHMKLDGENTKVVFLHSYKKYVYPAVAAAAIVLLFIGLQWNSNSVDDFSDLANSDIENYFDSNNFELLDYELAEVLPVHELEISDILEHKLNEDHIIEYLENNVDDFEELNITYDEQ